MALSSFVLALTAFASPLPATASSGAVSTPSFWAAPLVTEALRCDEDATLGKAASATPDSALVAAYARGQTWEQFLGEAQAMRELWQRNWERSTVPADVLALVANLPPGLKVLAIAVDSCSDSVNTIPYIARLVQSVPGLEMRVIKRNEGRPFMATRRTPDGRAATPTVILLDAAGEEVGCWVERPAALQAIAIEARAGGGTADFVARKQGWYDADAGASTMRELARLLAAARDGKRGCDAPRGSEGQ